MKKYIIGFIGGLLILAVVFCITVLVMGSLHDKSFTDEIKSWGETEEQETIPGTEREDLNPVNATILIGEKIDLV